MPDAGYRSATVLVVWMTVLLIAHAVICLAALPSHAEVIELMQEAAERRANAEPGGSWVDAYIVPSGFAQALTKLALVVLFCIWIPRANRNARALGATGLRFTPAWSVGWFFVPVMNLYKPYEAMREIWLASLPDDARKRAPLLGWWWALCLVSGAASLLAFELMMAGPDQWLLAARAHLYSDAVDIPLAIVAMLVVWRIHGMQERRRTTTAFD